MSRPLAIAIGVVLLGPAAAMAKPRVAVVAFEGDAKGEVQDVVAELLESDYTITGPKQVGRTIDKLGLDGEMSDKDLKKLANELDADAIVRGDLSQSGKHKLLHVRLYLNGKRVKGFKVEFGSVKSQKFKDALKEKMGEKLSGKRAAPASDNEDPIGSKKADKTEKVDKADKKRDKAESEDSEKADKADKEGSGENADKSDDDKGEDQAGDDEDPDKKKRVAMRGDNEGDDDIDAELGTGVTVSRSSPHTANRAAVRVDFSGSVSARRLAFVSRPDLGDDAPKPYANNPVPGARVGGELFPLAFGNPDSFAAGLGVAGEYDQTMGLKLRSTAQPGTEFPVEQKHWSVGGRFRVVFGRTARRPSVTLGGGYMQRTFKIDRSKLMSGNYIDVPDVLYAGFNPGLNIRIPITASVAMVMGGRAILLQSAGQITKGNQYGQAKMSGGEGFAGVDITIAKHFAVRLTGEFTQVGYTFLGNGDMTNNRDGNPNSPDVGGAADRYIGGAASVGVHY